MDTLERLEVDLIVTQAVCEVCAVSYDDVVAVAERLPTRPSVISLDPSTLGEVLADVPRLAEAAGVPEAGERLVEEASARIDAVERAVAGAPRPRTAALEWLDPVYVGGHWVPQMIEAAGGLDVLGFPGERSRTVEWPEVEAVSPEVVISMPCGLYAEEAAAETMRRRDLLAPLGARVVAVDAAAYFSRPGPRLVDGVELLGHLLASRARAGAGVAPLDRARPGSACAGLGRRAARGHRDRAGHRRGRHARARQREHAIRAARTRSPSSNIRNARERRRPRGRRCGRRSRCWAR